MKFLISITRRARCTGLAVICAIATASCADPSVEAANGTSQEKPRVEPDGTIHVPAFDLPESSFLSEETRGALKQWREVYGPDLGKVWRECPPQESAERSAMPAIRKCHADRFYKTLLYKSIRDRYEVDFTPAEMGGVYTEVFTPK